MEKKNVNGTETGNQDKVKLGAKIKNGIVKAWQSKPAKVIRKVGSVALMATGAAGAVYYGTRKGTADGYCDMVEGYTASIHTEPKPEPEAVPFNESEPTDVE